MNELIWLECSIEKWGEINKNEVAVRLRCLASLLQTTGKQLKGLDSEFLIKLCDRKVILTVV